MNPGMVLTVVPVPDGIWVQPLSELHRFFAEWQGKKGLCCQYAKRRASKLHFENFSPLFMSKTDVLVPKGPSDVFQLSFPFGGWLP